MLCLPPFLPTVSGFVFIIARLRFVLGLRLEIFWKEAVTRRVRTHQLQETGIADMCLTRDAKDDTIAPEFTFFFKRYGAKKFELLEPMSPKQANCKHLRYCASSDC